MKDPNDHDAYASYMGTKIKSSLIVPMQGEPGLALTLLFEKKLLLASRDNADSDNECLRVGIDELMTINLAAERLKDALCRRYPVSWRLNLGPVPTRCALRGGTARRRLQLPSPGGGQRYPL